MADVFVSYVSEDRSIAEKISRGLEGAGFSVWWDRHIHGGVGFRKEIDRQLGAAKVVVVLWSQASLDSEWVCDEAQQARDQNKLIPVRLDKVQPPLGFRQTQSLDFGGWNGDSDASAFASLLDSARHFLDRSSTEASLATAPSGTPKYGRWGVPKARLIAAAAIMALVIIAVVVALRFGLGVTAPTSDTASGRIEIGRFESLAQGEDTARFKNGLTDAIRRVFAANDIKTVAPREGAATDVADVPVSAEFSLRGTVDRDGGQYVVVTDILHRRDGLVVWSKTLRQDIGTVPQFQEHVSTYVTGVLNCALGYRTLAKGDLSVDLFSRFLGLCEARKSGQFDQTSILARRIVDVAPQYGISHALLASMDALFSSLVIQGAWMPAPERERLRAEANSAAKVAMELDPKHMAGLIDWTFAIIDDPSRDLAEREKLLQRNLSTDPAFQSQVLWGYANLLDRVGRTDEARSYYLRREEAFPSDLGWPPVFPSIELVAASGDIVTAREEFARLEPTRPTDEARFLLEFLYGDPAVAKEMSEDERYVRLLQPSHRRCVGAVLDAKLKRVPLSVEEIDAACAPRFNPQLDRELEELYANFGHVDAAYRLMETHPDWYASFYNETHLFLPEMRSVRADPRFMPFAARVGLVDYWLKTDHWPDFCTRDKLPYDCKEAARAAQAKVNLNPRNT